MIDYKKELNEIVKNFIEISNKYLQENEKNEKNSFIKENITERINSLDPNIMVYGIYNAGKSTLINALKGENVCVVGDRPETFKITPYEWNGYTIIDAPGVNVPIKEHEVVSEAHLKKSDIVLFVISTNGTFDEERNYVEMTKIIESSKKLLIILNNKDGYEKNDPEVIKIQSKILENLRRFSKNDNVGCKYEVLLVDAKTALEAKTEFKDEEDTMNMLINESNILEIEKKFLQTFKEIKTFDILKTPIYNLEQEINTLVNKIKTQLENEDEKEIVNIKNKYFELVENMSLNIECEINGFVVNYTDLLSTKILNREDVTSVLEDINSTYKKSILRNIDEVKTININNSKVKSSINSKIDTIRDMIQNPKVNMDRINFEYNGNLNSKNEFNYGGEVAVTGENYNILEDISSAMIQKQFIDTFAGKGIEATTKLVTQGALKKTALGALAGKAVGFLNPALTIATTVFTLSSVLSNIGKSNDEEKYLQAQQMAAIENQRAQEEANKRALMIQYSNSIAKSTMFDVENSLKHNLSLICIELKRLIDEEATLIMNVSENENNDKMNDIGKLDSLKNGLLVVKNNI